MAAPRRLLACLWRWSLCATLPVAAFFVAWLIGFAGRFATFRLRYDLGPYPFGFATEGGDFARQLANDLRLRLARRTVPDALRVVQLAVRTDRLAALDAELPHSGFRAVKGQILGEQGWVPIDLRYRGDFFYHWAYAKKSLRVRVAQQQTVFGLTTFDLIAPKLPAQVNDVAGYELARMLGVLTPRAEAVTLYVNGENWGLYQFVEHPQESLLRDRGRMPGDLYAGELVARDAWNGVDNLVFDHPGLWAKLAANDRFPADNRGPLRALCRLVDAPATEDSARALERLVDLDAFGRFFAAETLTQCLHDDEAHNWRLCYDPWRQRFEPLLWDPNAWSSVGADPEPAVSLDPVPSRLHALLLAHPAVLAARARALHRFLHEGGAEHFLATVRDLAARAARVAAVDPRLRPPDPGAVAAAIEALPGAIERTFAAVAAAEDRQEPAQWAPAADGLRLRVRGRTPVTAVVLQLAAPAGVDTALELRLRTPDGELRRPLAVARAGTGLSLRTEVTLPSQFVPAPRIGPGGEPWSTRAVAPATYALAATPALPPLRSVQVESADGRSSTAVPADLPAALPPVDLLIGVGSDQPAAPESWSGRVVVDALRTVDGDLFVAPGTEILLGAHAGLVLRGRLVAAGTAAQPIRIRRREPAAAWGTVALQGQRASGSRLSFCEFDGGSGLQDRGGLYDYSAMLCLHDAADVHVDRCSFAGGSRTGDAVHAVYADVAFTACRFLGAPRDALDLDRCAATVEGCEFTAAGDDGIDLDAGDAVVHRCTFTRCSGGGVTASKRARVLVAECRFDDCVRGLVAEDDADALAANCSITGGERGLEAARRNWRYGRGGRLEAHRCVLAGAGAPPVADAFARLLLRDCALAPWPEAAPNLLLDGCDLEAGPGARLPCASLPLPIPRRQALAAAIWSHLATGRRGAP